jgi:hypothetical protein
MHMAVRSASPGSSGRVASIPFEETSLFQGHTPFDGAVSDSPSGAGLETASWLPPISTLGS